MLHVSISLVITEIVFLPSARETRANKGDLEAKRSPQMSCSMRFGLSASIHGYQGSDFFTRAWVRESDAWFQFPKASKALAPGPNVNSTPWVPNYTYTTSPGLKFRRTWVHHLVEDAEYREVHFTWPG